MLEIRAGEAFFYQEFWEWLMEKLTFGQRLEGGVAEPGVGRQGLKRSRDGPVWRRRGVRGEEAREMGQSLSASGTPVRGFDPG